MNRTALHIRGSSVEGTMYIPSGQWDRCVRAENSIAMFACVRKSTSGCLDFVERDISRCTTGSEGLCPGVCLPKERTTCVFHSNTLGAILRLFSRDSMHHKEGNM